jgi:MerR family transcriptional regulator/heat shock protein HspR
MADRREPPTARGARSRSGAARRSLAERLNDPNEPLYTMAVAADLLGTDHQTLRRLGDALAITSARTAGNHRRYSRHELELFEVGLRLQREGHPPQSVARIIELERELTRRATRTARAGTRTSRGGRA